MCRRFEVCLLLEYYTFPGLFRRAPLIIRCWCNVPPTKRTLIMANVANPHSHSSVEEIIHPHEDMLADTPEQAAGPNYRSDKAAALAALREPGVRCCR